MKHTCKICNNKADVIDQKEYFCAKCMLLIIKRIITRNRKTVLENKVLQKN
jgi:hypothetical protein